ncbi:RNA-binding protein [Frigoribacterium sp. Leaf263]|uniref:ASCH domain-containing protein n=1 Tax=Frigoribacterium sp. Leaf263 TaxID=1736313 RepID=UPI0006F5F373|nr:ASCH domain-containing protein [Frigoribacterium sp. Leaf263]KQO81685.1 RNA-binding protein [Frigoribacterium sp. Leaf263]
MTAELPIIEFAFPGPLRDRIVAAIEAGTKTATSSLLREYEVAGEQVPQVGFRGGLVDSTGRRRVVLETTNVELVRLCDVPLQHALDEGEGYASVDDWRAGHLRFWSSAQMQEELGDGFTVDDSSVVVLERFEIVR